MLPIACAASSIFPEAISDGLVVAEQARGSAAHAALARAGARAAARTQEAAAKAHRVEELRAARQLISRQLSDVY